MDEHVIDHPRRHDPQPLAQPDGRVGRRARSPARALVAHPPHARRRRLAVEVAARQLGGSHRQLGVAAPGATPASPILGGETVEHDVDPSPLFRPRHARGQQHDGAVAVAIGRHRTAPARAAAHFDGWPISALPGIALLSRSRGALGGHGETVSPPSGCESIPRPSTGRREGQARSPFAAASFHPQARHRAPAGRGPDQPPGATPVHRFAQRDPQEHSAPSPPAAQRYPQVRRRDVDHGRDIRLPSAPRDPGLVIRSQGEGERRTGSGFPLSSTVLLLGGRLWITCGNQALGAALRRGCAAPERG